MSDPLVDAAATQRAMASAQLEKARDMAHQFALSLPRPEGDDGSAIAAVADALVTSLVLSVAASVNAAVMESESGIRAEMSIASRRASMTTTRRTALERNDAIRRAATSGQWDLFDSLVGGSPGDAGGEEPEDPA